MISYIICDDSKEFNIIIRNKIKKFMDQHKDIKYDMHSFSGYGKAFEDTVLSSNNFKVYFLDIETKKGSGLDAARMIREKYDDWNSIIIIVTNHEEFRFEALSNRLYLLDFINKMNNFDKYINDDLKHVLKTYNKNSKALAVEYDYEVHRIEFDDIVYIEKQIDSKKCSIFTLYGEVEIQSSLTDLYDKLDDRFMKVSRSLIVNLKMIRSYDSKENNIYFINDLTSNLVSRDFKEELRNRVKNGS